MLKPLFAQFWWLLPLLVVASIAKTSWFKGVLGEWMVKLSAKFLLDSNKYKALHNVTLKTPDGTTQIDHIFVSRVGIFVVETKITVVGFLVMKIKPCGHKNFSKSRTNFKIQFVKISSTSKHLNPCLTYH